MIRLTFETSGTTGEPKRVEHTLEAMMANAKAFNAAVGLNKHTRMYHCLPKAHMAGFLNTILCPTLAGGTVAFGPTFSAQTAGSFWVDFLDSGANTVWITPTIAAMLLRLNRGKPRWIHGLEHVFCGTAPLPAKVREEWLSTFHVPIQESYGTSEHMLVSVQGDEDALIEHNVGRVLPCVTVEIGDNSEIIVNGTGTGDQGELHDGKLTITGRLKDLIIRGGFNVSPVRVEEVVRQVCRDAAVVGQPDDFWGEKIVVFAEYGDKAMIDDHCHVHLPKSHWPDRIEIVDKLPRNGMGKVLKGELKSMLGSATRPAE
jgi:acyl-CoA synthetase (AMP-forming)/AMP-acid ligase II